MTHTWDPAQYLRYADERGRPFVELLARVGSEAPRSVVDLGCGPGTLTRLLAQRWPGARVQGVDSSAEMIAEARRDAADVDFAEADLRSWRPGSPVDVLVSNATLQWVPGHLELLPDLLATVRPGGWFAFAVPGNMGEPSHTLRSELAEKAPYAEHTRGVATPQAHDAATYLAALAAPGRLVDAWETTYLHVLTGPDPVFEWIRGTGARPTLQALPPGLREEFETELRGRLAAAYPEGPAGVVLPFRRVFVVVRTAEGDA